MKKIGSSRLSVRKRVRQARAFASLTEKIEVYMDRWTWTKHAGFLPIKHNEKR